MKISVFLFLAGIISMYAANSYSQTTRLSLDIRESTVGEVLTNIEDQSEFVFLYSNKLIDANRKVSLRVKNKPVSNILDRLFADTDVRYVVYDRQIILSPEEMLKKTIEQQNAPPQGIVVTGQVTDEEGNSLPGVNIVIMGTSTGVISDADGNYSIEVEDTDATLVFSFIGFSSQEVLVGNQTTINVVLEIKAVGLEEVIAVGYGTRKRGEIIGSVSNMSATTLEEVPAMSVELTLQGRLPGLVVNDRGGEPGQENISFLVRGSATLGNNSPLFVIDGVPQEGMGNLSPYDIKEVSVLKDASAAIYGARAANGVILITTKRGRKGKSELRLRSSYGVSTFTRLPKMANSWQYATMHNEIQERFGQSPIYSEEDIQKYKSGNFPITHPNTNWHDEVIRDFAPKSRHNLSASGGSENLQYYISGDYLTEGGMFKSGDKTYNQYQIRSNLDVKVTNYLNLGFDLSGKVMDDHSPYTHGDWALYQSRMLIPTEVGRYPNGKVAYSGGLGFNQILATSDAAGWNENIDKIFRSKLSFDLDLNWITEGLKLSGYGSFNFNTNDEKDHYKPITVWKYDQGADEYIKSLGVNAGLGSNIQLTQNSSFSNTQLYHLRLNYDKSFGNHNISAFAAYEQSEWDSRYTSAYRNSLYSEAKVEIFAGKQEGSQIDGGSSASGRVNYFGSMAYNYMRKYLVEFTLRRDGSFNFPEDKRFGTFPGISVGWRISDEPFMAATNGWLDDLKLRASLAKMGNDLIPNYQFLNKYVLQDMGTYGYPNYEGYIFGSPPSYYDAMVISSVANPNITWETSTTQNIGFDAAFWGEKLSVSFDYFYEKRRQILVTRSGSVPDYTALELPDENLGKVDNSGFELSLNHQNEVGELSYYVGGNVTYSRNEIIFMDEPKNVPEYRKKEGHSMYSWLIYETDGIFNTQEEVENTEAKLAGTQPGDIKYVDANGDGSIDDADLVRQYTSPIPEIQGGLNAGFRYKGFEVSLFFQGQANASTLFNWDQGNRPEFLFNKRWTEDNKDAEYPRIFDRNDFYNRPSTFFLYNSTFIRLKNAMIAYNLDRIIPENNAIKNIKIYVQGSNLWTLSPIKYFDPEVSSGGAGVDYYPQVTRISFGINITL